MQLTADRTFLNQIDEIRDKIFRITKRILVSQEEAEDATQEVSVKLWQMDVAKRNGFKSIEAYSVTMAKNYCLDRLKSKQAQTLSLDERFGGPAGFENCREAYRIYVHCFSYLDNACHDAEIEPKQRTS